MTLGENFGEGGASSPCTGWERGWGYGITLPKRLVHDTGWCLLCYTQQGENYADPPPPVRTACTKLQWYIPINVKTKNLSRALESPILVGVGSAVFLILSIV